MPEGPATSRGDELGRWILDTHELRAVWDPSPQDEPREGVSGLAHVCGRVARMHLANVRDVRAHLSEEIGRRLRVRVPRIPRNRTERRRPRVVVEDEVIVGEVVISKRRIVAAGRAQDRRAARPSPDEHGRERLLRQADAGGASAHEGVKRGDVLIEPADDHIRSAPCPFRKVRGRRGNVDLIFRRLTLLAEKELAGPHQHAPPCLHFLITSNGAVPNTRGPAPLTPSASQRFLFVCPSRLVRHCLSRHFNTSPTLNPEASRRRSVSVLIAPLRRMQSSSSHSTSRDGSFGDH
jgi:hypothetical protein